MIFMFVSWEKVSNHQLTSRNSIAKLFCFLSDYSNCEFRREWNVSGAESERKPCKIKTFPEKIVNFPNVREKLNILFEEFVDFSRKQRTKQTKFLTLDLKTLVESL